MATSIVVRRGSGDIGVTHDSSDSGAMAERRGLRRTDGGAVYPAAMGATGAGLARGPGGARVARLSTGVAAFRPGAHELGVGWRGHPGDRGAAARFPGRAAALLHAPGQPAELAVAGGLQAGRDLPVDLPGGLPLGKRLDWRADCGG